MSNLNKLSTILGVCFFMLICVHSQTQDKYSPKQGLKNLSENIFTPEKDIFKEWSFSADRKDEIQRKYPGQNYNSLPVMEEYSDQSGIIPNRTALTVNKLQLTGDVLDSVIYLCDGEKHKEIFAFDCNLRLLTRQYQHWYTPAAGWANDGRITYTYDVNGNMLTGLHESWDINAGTWVNIYRVTYSYDGNGNMLTDLFESWLTNTGIWLNINRVTYTYDGNGNMISSSFEIWKGLWRNSSRHTYTYDGKGNRLTNLYEVLVYGTWEKYYLKIYTYDDSGNILTSLHEVLHIDDDMVGCDTRETYTYDGMGNMLTIIYQFRYPDVELWLNSSRQTFTYDNSSIILSYLNEHWDFTAEKWVVTTRHTYTYDGSGNRLIDLFESWDTNTGTWVNIYRVTYTYDGNGNMLNTLKENWDKDPGIWINFWAYTYTYDGNENLIYFKSERWSGSAWIAHDRRYELIYNGYSYPYYCAELSAYYSPLTPVENSGDQVLNSFSLSQNFPNPFNPTTQINFTLPQSSKVRIEVYNRLGQKVSTLVDEYMTAGYRSIKFNGENLASGVYYYRMEAGNFINVKKMIILK